VDGSEDADVSDSVTGSLRHAGGVERYHTWPTIRKQTVADHTYHVLRIYYEIFGPPSPEVTTYVLFHDSPEVKYGDPPFPAKRDNPELKRVYTALENQYYDEMFGFDHSALVDDEEIRRVKICDLLEMWEFGCVELRMGNQYARPIIERTLDAAMKIGARYTLEINKYVNGAIL
jgi:5'-deoxynucleotidase YfbR-like HD superfamily hydrolase